MNQYSNLAVFSVFSTKYINCHKKVLEMATDLNIELKQIKKTILLELSKKNEDTSTANSNGNIVNDYMIND